VILSGDGKNENKSGKTLSIHFRSKKEGDEVRRGNPYSRKKREKGLLKNMGGRIFYPVESREIQIFQKTIFLSRGKQFKVRGRILHLGTLRTGEPFFLRKSDPGKRAGPSGKVVLYTQ